LALYPALFLPLCIGARMVPGSSTMPNGGAPRVGKISPVSGSESWFREMAKYAKPDAHLYEVCYLLDRTDTLSEVRVDAKR
jgi:hypothetical protein